MMSVVIFWRLMSMRSLYVLNFGIFSSLLQHFIPCIKFGAAECDFLSLFVLWPSCHTFTAVQMQPYLLTYLLTCLLTYYLLLTPWCRVLLENLTGLQLVKKFPAFHGTRKFITALTRVRHPSLSWASPIQSIYPHPTSWRSILIISTHLRLGLPCGLLPSGFPSKQMQP